MIKYLLPLSFALLTFASCDKDTTVISGTLKPIQNYALEYNKDNDSFKATAFFVVSGTVTPLSQNDQITMNGMTPQLVNNQYVWLGKGTPDANFIVVRNGVSYVNTIPFQNTGEWNMTVADTVFIPQGFNITWTKDTIMNTDTILKNNFPNINISTDGKTWLNNTPVTDAVFVPAEALVYFNNQFHVVLLTNQNSLTTTAADSSIVISNTMYRQTKQTYISN